LAHLGIYPNFAQAQNASHAGWLINNVAWVLFGLPVGRSTRAWKKAGYRAIVRLVGLCGHRLNPARYADFEPPITQPVELRDR